MTGRGAQVVGRALAIGVVDHSLIIAKDEYACHASWIPRSYGLCFGIDPQTGTLWKGKNTHQADHSCMALPPCNKAQKKSNQKATQKKKTPTSHSERKRKSYCFGLASHVTDTYLAWREKTGLEAHKGKELLQQNGILGTTY